MNQTNKYRIEVVYSTGDCGWEDDFPTKELGIEGFKGVIEDVKEECEPDEIEYAKLYFEEDDEIKNIMFWSFDNGFSTPAK